MKLKKREGAVKMFHLWGMDDQHDDDDGGNGGRSSS